MQSAPSSCILKVQAGQAKLKFRRLPGCRCRLTADVTHLRARSLHCTSVCHQYLTPPAAELFR